MLTEEAWLKITQSFPNVEESSNDKIEPENLQLLAKPAQSADKNFIAKPLHSVPENEASKVSAEAKMREMLKQRALAKSWIVKTQPSKNSQIISSKDKEVMCGMETMELKLRSLASRLVEKDRKIQEQELMITKLERKMATQCITGALASEFDAQEFQFHQTDEKLTEVPETQSQVFHKRLMNLESQMKMVLLTRSKSQSQSFSSKGLEETECIHPVVNNETDVKLVREASKLRNQPIKPRSNLASIYRLNSHGASGSETLDKAVFDEKISNLEKIVDSLKQFMLVLILKKSS